MFSNEPFSNEPLSNEPFSLPIRSQPPAPASFPLMATLAPLAAAALIWLVTGSAFALIFAVLSPVIALASMVDSRRTRRKRAHRDCRDYEEAVRLLRASIAERQEELRCARDKQTPSVQSILADPTGSARWRRSDPTVVSLGVGAIESGLRISGTDPAGEHRDLRVWAATLTDAPVTIDLSDGLGIVGPRALARSLARGVLVQVCFSLPPSACSLGSFPVAGWAWTDGLPHAWPDRPFRVRITESSGERSRESSRQSSAGPEAVVARAVTGQTVTSLLIHLGERLEDLPPGCATVVHLEGPDRAVLVCSARHSGGLVFRPELVSVENAARFAAEARTQANAAGLLPTGAALPCRLAFSDLVTPGLVTPAAPTIEQSTQHRPDGNAATLRCPLGRSEDGDLSIDLVRAGPHAVVGGTTGSGKSELLVTWVTSLATTYSPDQVTFLLVDFKGGAAFQPLCGLPHCVGLITDLDANGAARALASLAAELQHRERVLSAAQATDVSDSRVSRGPTALPRLVIVVDEFATMINVFPDLHALFVDVAARGRSLGVHLILCTQRPSGVVRDALLANCSLRLSLRVNNTADSQSVIGTDGAASLDPEVPGRCLVATSSVPVLCQIATTGEVDILGAARRWAAFTGSVRVRRPWLDPLPLVLTRRDLVRAVECDGDGAGGLLLGVVDEPNRQRYRVARWDPARDGHLFVVGGAGSGKTSLLLRLTAQATAPMRTEFVPADVEATWDALSRACDDVEAGRLVGRGPHLMLLDDFDSVCARWNADHRAVALDRLAMLLRDGSAQGVVIVMAVQRLAGALHALLALCPNTMLLRSPTAQDHVAAGGMSAQFDAKLPPGGGHWQGLRVQLCAEPAVHVVPPSPAVAPHLADTRVLLVVSVSPRSAATRWAAAFQEGCSVVNITGVPALVGGDRLAISDSPGPVIVVGDADSWQAQWALLDVLRTRATVIFEGNSLADFRAISRRRELPPPLAAGRGHMWVLQPDGSVARASLPAPVEQTPAP